MLYKRLIIEHRECYRVRLDLICSNIMRYSTTNEGDSVYDLDETLDNIIKDKRDRKSVGEGKGVDAGGRRLIKRKKVRHVCN